MEKNDYDGRNKNRKYNNNKNNINNKGIYVLVCLVVNIYIYIYMKDGELLCIQVIVSWKKKTESEIIELINKRK